MATGRRTSGSAPSGRSASPPAASCARAAGSGFLPVSRGISAMTTTTAPGTAGPSTRPATARPPRDACDRGRRRGAGEREALDHDEAAGSTIAEEPAGRHGAEDSCENAAACEEATDEWHGAEASFGFDGGRGSEAGPRRDRPRRQVACRVGPGRIRACACGAARRTRKLGNCEVDVRSSTPRGARSAARARAEGRRGRSPR